MNNPGILDRTILDRIDSLKSQIDYSKLENFVRGNFNVITEQVIANVPIQDSDNRIRPEEVIKNFRIGWDYARANSPPSFTQENLEEIAGRVEPALCVPTKSYAAIRTSSASLAGYSYLPPVDEGRIRNDMENVINSIGAGLHPLAEALFLYFNLMRIQPFVNGNKRTANIVMNTRLLKEDFAPISIPPEEELLFKQYYEGALLGFEDSRAKHNPNSLVPYLQPELAQKQFYEYLARKEENNLRGAIDYLTGLDRYKVILETKSPGVIYTLKEQIAGWFHRNKDSSYQQKLSSNKSEIEVIGKIPHFTLSKILDANIAPNKGLKAYKIKIIKKH